MVKGVSRQVVVIHTPDTKLYEQAIFILRDDAPHVSDDVLLREAMQAAQRAKRHIPGWIWAACGAGVTGIIWLVTGLLRFFF